jgi:hypothetical protein
LWSAPRRWSSPRCGRRLERVTQTAVDRAFQQGTVEHDPYDSALDTELATRRQELPREWERVAHAQSHRRVKLPCQRQVEESRVGDAPRDTASRRGDSGDLVLRQHVVSPFGRGVDSK